MSENPTTQDLSYRPATGSMAASPIADLSYRNYSGGLESPRLRWWVIARMGLNQALKKKSLWVCTVLGGWYYLAMIFVLYFMEQTAARVAPGRPGMINPAQSMLQNIVWKDHFLHGISFGQLMFLIVALLIGAGTIANDNRANALLVYLSKPCTKGDYLIGKWMGVFLPLLIAVGLPSLVFYFYGSLSYYTYGFLKDDPWLILRVLSVIVLTSAFHASLIVGVSSLFSQGRIAGATYAGIYFLTNFFTVMMGGIYMGMSQRGHGSPPPILHELFYFSLDGLNIGASKGILKATGSTIFGFSQTQPTVPSPSLWLMLSMMILLSGLSLWIAWKRIRAVEVVG